MRAFVPFAGALALATFCHCSPQVASTEGEAKIGQSSQAIYSNARTNITISGVFRAPQAGVNTLTAVWVPDTTFFAANGTIAQMGAKGYTLVDVDIDTSTGQRYYTAVFQSGVPTTQYWELTPTDFATKVAALEAQGIGLVSLHTYLAVTGTIFYSGVFQSGTPAQLFPGVMSWATFTSTVNANAANGYFLSSLAVYATGNGAVGGEGECFLGVWQYHPQSTNKASLWVSEWNSFAKETMTLGAQSQRLVSMAHWEFYGDRKYAGQWIDGTDAYDVVAATDASVFERKVTELAAIGKVPIRINIEHGYEPPLGLAAAFNDRLDPDAVGYSYAISEKGATTALGGFGYARSPWDTNPNFPSQTLGGIELPMSEQVRLDVASVTKMIAAVAIFKLLEDPTIAKTTTLNTPIMSILGTGVLNGGALGAGVSTVTIRELLDMDAGIYEGSCATTYARNHPGWLACTLANCTQQLNADGSGPEPCALPGTAITSTYNGAAFGVLRSVVEALANEDFDSYLHNAIFVPVGVDNGALSSSALTNANCNPDLSTTNRPLYYASGQASGEGTDEQDAARDLDVCGTGGMQITAAQANTFLSALMAGKILQPADVTMMLSMWVIEKQTTLQGTSYQKNGGYPITTVAKPPGPTASVAVIPSTNTQVAVFANTQGTDSSNVNFDPDGAVADGLTRMGAYPIDTVTVVNRNSATYGAMCLNVTGDSTADNKAIIQWTCGAAPVANNMRFVELDAGNGQFMLQGVDSGKCVTVQYNDDVQGEIMIQYDCNGGANQVFTLRPNEKSFPNIVVNSTGMCLTVTGVASNASIVQEPCLDGSWTQEWAFRSVNSN